MLVQDAAALDNKLQGVRQDYHGDLDHFERYARPATASGTTPRRDATGPQEELMCRLMEKVVNRLENQVNALTIPPTRPLGVSRTPSIDSGLPSRRNATML